MSEFVKVSSDGEIEEGSMKVFGVKDKEIVLVKVGGKLYAFDNECTHRGGSLGEGGLNEHVVTCPWHMAQFDVRTGKVLSLPATESVKTYEVKVEGGDVLVNV